MGQSAFVVMRDTPGVSVGTPYLKSGLTSSPLAAVYFTDCRVPAHHLVGGEGQGARIFARSMAWERACLFAAFVGAMDAQLERCVDYARRRIQYGRAIGANQAISHRIAEMKRRLEAARLLLYQACWKRDRGQEATLEISLAKLAISEAAVESGLDEIRIHGGAGYMKESGADRGLLDGIGSTLFSGTSDIQRELIAHRLLGSITTQRAGTHPRARAAAPANGRPSERHEHNYATEERP
jgi:alkylation response protein AidB-like acyl-CoA dehydrogenase